MNKNNILLLVIIILIIILIAYGYFIFFKLNKELFQSNQEMINETVRQNMEESRHKCKFYPWGPTLESCKRNCLNIQRIGLWDETGEECNEEVCSEICGLCTYEPACQWIASWTNQEKEKMLKINKEDNVLAKLVPRSLNITGISYPDSDLYIPDSSVNIKLTWTNYGDTKGFMVHFYNMKESENMIKVENITDGNAEEYNLTGLKSGSQYSVIMYAINEYGVSRGSNIILVDT